VSAAEVILRRRGDCSEYSLLTIALLRALGVPAKIEQGLAAAGDELVAHAWVSYHDGVGWRELDPVSHQLQVSSRYLPVSLPEIVSLLALGRLRVVE
jgi:hypothetical protein